MALRDILQQHFVLLRTPVIYYEDGIDVPCQPETLRLTPDELWFKAFEEHYKSKAESLPETKKVKEVGMHRMTIGDSLEFTVDRGHLALKFSFDADDTLLKEIAESFVNYLVPID